MQLKILILCLLTISISSCSVINSHKNSNMYYLNLHKTVPQKYKATKQLSSYDYTENNVSYFIQQGYVMIGYDAIRHTYIGYQEAVNTGCWIGATVMLYKHVYIGSSSGNAIVPLYNPGETYTINSTTNGSMNSSSSASASVFGSNGYAYGNAYGTTSGTYQSNTKTTITAPGSFSYYSVPYTNHYYDQYALYFVKPTLSTSSGKMYKADITIDLFKGASYNSGIIMKVYPDVPFKILNKGKKFIKIQYQQTTGYILNGAPITLLN